MDFWLASDPHRSIGQFIPRGQSTVVDLEKGDCADANPPAALSLEIQTMSAIADPTGRGGPSQRFRTGAL
ncbi:hypothetical protein BRAS3843_770015 [Bradyrhizobium sp. STM 3843]|nr:hypothetical protein BRAS3843_770015 [Bradyrhizobium sp. STM 3843]